MWSLSLPVSRVVGVPDAASVTTPPEAPGWWVIPLQMGSGSVAVSRGGGGRGARVRKAPLLCLVLGSWALLLHQEGRGLESWCFHSWRARAPGPVTAPQLPWPRVPLCLGDWSGMLPLLQLLKPAGPCGAPRHGGLAVSHFL